MEPRGLQEELSRMKEEGASSSPKPVTPSPQTTLRQKESAIPAGSGMLRAFPWVVLKDLLPQRSPEALSNNRKPPSKVLMLMFPACKRGTQREVQQEPPRHFPGLSTTGQGGRTEVIQTLGQLAQARKWGGRGHQAQARSFEDKYHPDIKVSVLPVPRVPRDHFTTNWAQWHSEKSAGTRRSPNSSFTNYPSRDLSRRLGPEHQDGYKVPGDHHGSLTRICWSLPHWTFQGH